MTQDMEQVKVMSSRGDILTCQCQHSTRDSELIFSRLSFQQDAGSFSKSDDITAVISRKSTSDVEIVHCTSVLGPWVLLMQSRKGDRFDLNYRYSLLTLSSSNRLEPYMEFKLPYRITDNVEILKGPTVLWSHDGVVFYTSMQAGSVRQIPIEHSLSFIGGFLLNRRNLCILGSQKLSAECLKEQMDVAGVSKTLGYFIEDGQVFNGALILPQAYSSITKCMFVVSAVEVNGVLQSTVVAATSKKQLVYFENGIPREVCQLPFEEPEHIQIVNTGRNGCLLFAVTFNHGHACAVWKDTFQVASCWSGVSSLHVDDFLGGGTDQVLLIFGDQSLTGGPLDRFLITDLCGTTYSHGQESRGGQKTCDADQENFLLTVQALESRLQSGLTMLQDLQRDVRVKERVLLQSTHAVSGTEHVVTQAEQEGLVSLWDDGDEPDDEALAEKMQVTSGASPPLVDKLWHHFIEDRLIVGVMLTTESLIPVGSVSLSILLTEAGQSPVPLIIQTRSRASWFPTPSPLSAPSHPEPVAKRRRLDGASGAMDVNTHRLAVTAVTDLSPLLTSGSVECPVMLHYVHRQGSPASANAPGPTVTQCGHVPVDFQSKAHPQLLTSCEFTTDEAREDLLSLLAVLDSWTLQIHSPDHTLDDVARWIQKSMQCQRLAISPCYLLANPAGPSAVMLFYWHQTTPFQGELSVHCSQLRLLHFLNSLCDFLPASASCSILPVRKVGGEGTAQRLALSLEKEVLSLKEGMSSLLHAEEEGTNSDRVRKLETPDTGSAEELQRCRDEWERDRGKSRRRLSPLVDMERYHRLTQSLAQMQLEGDIAALLETHSSGSRPLRDVSILQ